MIRNTAAICRSRFLSIALFLTSCFILSCSGGGGSGTPSRTQPPSGSAGVLLYVTDDVSNYLQVIATFNSVKLVSTSGGVVCDVLPSPTTFDITHLADVLQLTGSSTCPAGKYNRIDIEFARDVQLMDSSEQTSSCRFASYLNDVDQLMPLACNAATDTCTVEIPGAARSGAFDLMADRVNSLALDFDLKKFTVHNFGDPLNCSVVLKVTPLHDADIQRRGIPAVITGTISQLDTAARTFRITQGAVSAIVNYTAIVTADHPGLETMLRTAQENGISVMVATAVLDSLHTPTISTTDILLAVAGTVSNLVKTGSDRTFTLTYDSSKTLVILSSPPAGKKHGNLTDGSWVDVQLYGYDSSQSTYLSSLVSVQRPGP